jgi:hypothetical protein
MPLSAPPLIVTGDDGKPERRRIDRLVATETSVLVADYKTDRVRGDLDAYASRYAGQGEAYMEAVRLATGQSCGFHCIFLRSGKIVEITA